MNDFLHFLASGIVASVGIWIKLEISKLREKTLEDERVLRDWVDEHFVRKPSSKG
jgi:hypothetical protein